MKWDGYGASIRDTTARQVVHHLADALGGLPGQGPTQRRYGPTISIEVGGRMAAWVGTATDGLIYVEGKGVTSPALVDAIRTRFPVHGAPRLDVAEDYAGEGAFEALQALVRRHKGPRVKGGYVALPDDDSDGRTWCAGVRGGTAYARVYEPGKMKERVGQFAANAVRVELEARPHYARDKRAAATMAPLEVWGLTHWTQQVGQALTQCEISRFEPEIRSYSFDKTTRYIATAFRRHLEEMVANGEDLARTFQAVWEEEDAEARRH